MRQRKWRVISFSCHRCRAAARVGAEVQATCRDKGRVARRPPNTTCVLSQNRPCKVSRTDSARIEYLQGSRLPDGQLARFHALETNRPVYFSRDYKPTYDDGDVPTHYAFKVGDRTDSILKEFERLKKLDFDELRNPGSEVEVEPSLALDAEIRALIESQDDRGSWIEPGPCVIIDRKTQA